MLSNDVLIAFLQSTEDNIGCSSSSQGEPVQREMVLDSPTPTLLEISVLQGFKLTHLTNPYPTCPKGYSRCEKPLKVF
jgi:hypothetical protein